MKKGIYCQIKDLEILIVRILFNTAKLDKFRPPTITQARIMDYILEHKEEVYQKNLEKALNLRRATVSEVLKTMEKKNLIKREKNSLDARSKKIILLENSKCSHNKIKNNIAQLEETLIENITKEELETFTVVLKKMQYNLKDKYNKQGGKYDKTI